MIATSLLQIVVTVFLVGQPPIMERLPTLYKVTNDACERKAEELKLRARDDVNVSIECVEVDHRDT